MITSMNKKPTPIKNGHVVKNKKKTRTMVTAAPTARVSFDQTNTKIPAKSVRQEIIRHERDIRTMV